MGEELSRAFRSSAGKGRAQFHCWRAEPGPQVPDQSPLPAQEAPQGGVPSCCSPGRVPCRRRAASPHGWPCPPSWGQRAGGTAGTEGMAPAGMAGGTPRRTCRGQGAWAPAHMGQQLSAANCVFLETVTAEPKSHWLDGHHLAKGFPPSRGLLGCSAISWSQAELQLWLCRTCAGPKALVPARVLATVGAQP